MEKEEKRIWLVKSDLGKTLIAITGELGVIIPENMKIGKRLGRHFYDALLDSSPSYCQYVNKNTLNLVIREGNGVVGFGNPVKIWSWEL